MESPFIDKIRQIVLDHIDDDKFGVSELASEIGLSRSQTFRKVKSVTGRSVNQFIRETWPSGSCCANFTLRSSCFRDIL